MGYSPWSPIELDMPEGLKQHSTYSLYKTAKSNITARGQFPDRLDQPWIGVHKKMKTLGSTLNK